MIEKQSESIQGAITKGLTLGGSLAALIGLTQYLTDRRRITGDEDSSEDDDTLYIYKDENLLKNKLEKQSADSEQEQKDSVFALGAGSVATVASLIGGLQLIKWLRKKQLQEDMDRSQIAVLNANGYSPVMTKKSYDGAIEIAKKYLGGAANVGLALSALLALGGGVLTYQYLDDKYPKVKLRKKPLPRKYKIITDPNRVHDLEAEDIDEEESIQEENKKDEENNNIVGDILKYSSDLKREQFYDDGMTVVAHLIQDMKKESSTKDIVAVVAMGGYKDLDNSILLHGFDKALSFIKGASQSVHLSPEMKNLITNFCVKKANFSPLFKLNASQEFLSSSPFYSAASLRLPSKTRAELGELMQKLGRTLYEESCEKVASFNSWDINYVKTSDVDKLFKQSASELINNVVSSSSELSGGGITSASKKDKEIIKQEAEVYEEAKKKNPTQDVSKDAIDELLLNDSEANNQLQADN